MKLMVISDVHGDFNNLKIILDIYKRNKYEQLIITGDLCVNSEIINLLIPFQNELKLIKGNSDYYYTNQILGVPLVSIIKMPIKDNVNIYFTHGDRGIPNVDYNDKDILCVGHTHIPAIYKAYNLLIANSGSISKPRGNYEKTYMEINDKEILIYNFNGKVKEKYNIE